MNTKSIIETGTFTVVDVRTPEEFRGGHVINSINIPLQEIKTRLSELKSLTQPLILCCASGGRSGMATEFLQNEGINCCNGGGWLSVNKLI